MLRCAFWLSIAFTSVADAAVKGDFSPVTALTTFSSASIGVHSNFAQGIRHFFIGGQNWTVEQDWDADGVAGVVWQASVVLSEHIAGKVFNFTGQRVIELGAGAGLPGLLAAVQGASVVLTDHRSAIHTTKRSIRLNKTNKTAPLNVSAKALNWGSSIASFNPPVDYVLGADVVYLQETFPLLLSSLQMLTECRKSTVVLAITIRYLRDIVFLEMFEEKFRCDWVDFDNVSHILLLHAQKYCPEDERELLSCTKTLGTIRSNLS